MPKKFKYCVSKISRRTHKGYFFETFHIMKLKFVHDSTNIKLLLKFFSTLQNWLTARNMYIRYIWPSKIIPPYNLQYIFPAIYPSSRKYVNKKSLKPYYPSPLAASPHVWKTLKDSIELLREQSYYIYPCSKCLCAN